MNNKAAKGTWAAAFTVASVWFGTHVGGGFASGNQVVSYFAQYGMWAAVLPPCRNGHTRTGDVHRYEVCKAQRLHQL